MNALLAALAADLQQTFTATATTGSAVLTNPSSIAGLQVGLPVFGPNVQRGATITSLSPLTLSLPALGNYIGATYASGFQTISRRFKFWTDCAAQPALFLRDSDEELDYPQGQAVLQMQTMKAELWIYSAAGENPDAAPATALNNLLDAVQSVFAPDDPSSGRFTLGGLVFWCRLERRIQQSPGDIDPPAIAVVDVEITVP